MKLRRNVGRIDRALRFGLGSLFLYLGFIESTMIADQLARALLGGMGIMLIVIAIIAWCPFYFLIDYSSISEKA